MTIERTSYESVPANLSLGSGPGEVPEFTETQRLTWEVCDGVITDEELRRLEDLLRESPEARNEYISVMSIHQSLIEIFSSSTSRLLLL